jgi:hypothetical protein
MDDREWDATKDIILRSHDDVRRLQERGQLILGAGLAAAGLSIPIIHQAPDVGFAMSELLFTFAFAWHLNLNAEVASIAEVRDFLSERANEQLDGAGRPFRFVEVGEVGRGRLATVFTGALPLTILLGFYVAGGLSAFRVIDLPGESYSLGSAPAVAMWSVVTAICVVAFVSAGLADSVYRDDMRTRLGLIDEDYKRPNVVRRLWRLIFRRDKQGWNRDRATEGLARTPRQAAADAPDPRAQDAAGEAGAP